MILKGSQRGGGANLAAHLTNTRENDHVEIAEIRGTAAHDLKGAFLEIEATSHGTKAKHSFFSVSFNPRESEELSRADFERSFSAVEEKMGLSGQPRAVVFHEKNGREHAHVIWSRIDTERMRAIELSFSKLKLREVSRELHREFGLEMPDGLKQEKNWHKRSDPLNYDQATWQQSKRLDEDPRDLKKIIGRSYEYSDSARSFNAALESHALQLARGDRRGFVVVHHSGEVLGLRQYLGVRAKDIHSRLGKPEHVQTVDQARSMLRDRMTAAAEKRVEELKSRHAKERKPLLEAAQKLKAEHCTERQQLAGAQKAREGREALERASSHRKGVMGLWDRLGGKLGLGRIARENALALEVSQKRDGKERHAMRMDQLRERRQLQKSVQHQQEKHRRERQAARNVLGHWLKMDKPSLSEQVRDHYREIGKRKESYQKRRGKGRSRSRSRDRGPSLER
jgi:hypothetical protein